MRENTIEEHCILRAEQYQGVALKIKLIGRRGAADRWIILPGPRFGMLELKRPVGGRKSIHQIKFREAMHELGVPCEFACTKAEVDVFINRLACMQPQMLSPLTFMLHAHTLNGRTVR